MKYRPPGAMLVTAVCLATLWAEFIAPLLVAANPDTRLHGLLGLTLCSWSGCLGIGLLVGHFWEKR